MTDTRILEERIRHLELLVKRLQDRPERFTPTLFDDEKNRLRVEINALNTALLDGVVDLVNDQEIDGVKTFKEIPVLPDDMPVDDEQAASKGYVDGELAGIDLSDYVDKTTAQTIGGKKTFTTIPELPASNPVNPNQAARKKYVDDNIPDTSDFVDMTSAQTIGGIKTFTSIPVLPASDPASDNQAVRKAYVDALASKFSGCMVRRTSNQSISNGTPNLVTWQTALYDTDSYWSAGDATKILIPVDGLYQIMANVTFEANATGTRAFVIQVNGDSSDYVLRPRGAATNAGEWAFYGSTNVILHENDYLEMTVYQNSGAARNLVSGGNSPSISIMRIGDIPT